MRNDRDHEKRVLLEDISSDDTMISSLALCEKEEVLISSNSVDQDEDTSAVQGFEDEVQLYQALKLRAEHGQFTMIIGATSTLNQIYLDDDDSQDSDDDDDTSMDDDETSIDDPMNNSEDLTQKNWRMKHSLTT